MAWEGARDTGKDQLPLLLFIAIYLRTFARCLKIFQMTVSLLLLISFFSAFSLLNFYSNLIKNKILFCFIKFHILKSDINYN